MYSKLTISYYLALHKFNIALAISLNIASGN